MDLALTGSLTAINNNSNNIIPNQETARTYCDLALLVFRPLRTLLYVCVCGQAVAGSFNPPGEMPS